MNTNNMSKEWNVMITTQFVVETKVIADTYEEAQQKANILLHDENELPSIMDDEPETFVTVGREGTQISSSEADNLK
ncbi:hypothetical protein ABC382_01025 [Lysinibacillus sp. 1P01SD]|uniref:hypothetical protein n=1 Tax=Lysinibacillus sp. 1P01SD TaxID=3132285 RepID=UPI00399F65F8